MNPNLRTDMAETVAEGRAPRPRAGMGNGVVFFSSSEPPRWVGVARACGVALLLIGATVTVDSLILATAYATR